MAYPVFLVYFCADQQNYKRGLYIHTFLFYFRIPPFYFRVVIYIFLKKVLKYFAVLTDIIKGMVYPELSKL
jgi:hypothetical protein